MIYKPIPKFISLAISNKIVSKDFFKTRICEIDIVLINIYIYIHFNFYRTADLNQVLYIKMALNPPIQTNGEP